MAAPRTRSKKPSAASSRSQPEPPAIFLDECLGGHTIATALHKVGLDVKIQDARSGVPRGLDDPAWARLVAGRGWVTVKGFAKPVRTYRVAGIYDDLVKQGKIIRKEEEGIRILVDLDKRDRADAIKAIKDVLSQLED